MSNIARFAMLVAAICAMAAACAGPGRAGPSAAADPTPPASPANPAGDQSIDAEIADYVLGAGDMVRISVFGEETLAGQFSVSAGGKISFPLIGDVQAAGKTMPELRAEITAALADGYIKDPRVSAEVITFRPYYILGEVEKPGNYPYVNGITVMNAIATAGGFTYRANTHDVFIKKPNETVEHKVRLNDTLKLAPGDTVRISERYF